MVKTRHMVALKRPEWRRISALWLALGVLLSSAAAPCLAQESTVSVDLFRGPVVSSARVIGLGGAYRGIAEGVQGMGANVASLGNRFPHSEGWFEWDFTLDWLNLVPGDFVDMDNDGHSGGDESYMAINAGLAFLFGRFGIGLWLGSDKFTVESDAERITYDFLRSSLGLTYAFFEEQLVLGAALTSASLEVATFTNLAQAEAEADWKGNGDASWAEPGGQFSMLWRPPRLPLRVGCDFLLPVAVETSLEAANVELHASVPDRVLLPWRLGVGASWYYSPSGRRYNRPAGGPQSASSDRRYLLVAADLVLHGAAAENATTTGAYATGVASVSGQDPSLAVHVGVESEVWNNRLILRSGSYLEPNRVEGARPRLHGTFGLDVRVFKLWRWQFRAGATIDGARDYLNWGLGLGFWH